MLMVSTLLLKLIHRVYPQNDCLNLPASWNWRSPAFHYSQTDGLLLSTKNNVCNLSQNLWSQPCHHLQTDHLHPSTILKLMVSTLPIFSSWWSPPFHNPQTDGLHPSTILKLMVSTLPLSSNWWSLPFHYPKNDGLHPSTILKMMVSTLPLSSNWWSPPFDYPQTDGLHLPLSSIWWSPSSTILKPMVSTLPVSSNWWSPWFHYPPTVPLHVRGIWLWRSGHGGLDCGFIIMTERCSAASSVYGCRSWWCWTWMRQSGPAGLRWLGPPPPAELSVARWHDLWHWREETKIF